MQILWEKKISDWKLIGLKICAILIIELSTIPYEIQPTK